MANVCACGCGELLPENSTRQFKRGHKNRGTETAAGEFTETGIPDADQLAEDQDQDQPLSLADAAAITPDDEAPRDAPGEQARTLIKITAAVRKDVEGKVAFLLTMTGQAWALPDPICGNAVLQNSASIAKSVTPLICQSPELVRWFRKSGQFMLWVNLMMSLWPVLQVIYAHHIARSIVAGVPSQNGQSQPAPAPDMYVVR